MTIDLAQLELISIDAAAALQSVKRADEEQFANSVLALVAAYRQLAFRSAHQARQITHAAGVLERIADQLAEDTSPLLDLAAEAIQHESGAPVDVAQHHASLALAVIAEMLREAEPSEVVFDGWVPT